MLRRAHNLPRQSFLPKTRLPARVYIPAYSRGYAAQAAERQSSETTTSSMMGMGMGMMGMAKKAPRKEGDIGSVFASLSGEAEAELPERFLDLKRSIIGNADNQARLVQSWTDLTGTLRRLAPDIEKKQQDCIPITNFEEFAKEPSSQLLDRVKESGTVIVRNTVSEEEATQWLRDLEAYITANPQVKGFPSDDKQVFELYWSKAQLAARSHPRSLTVQRALLTLFHADPSAQVSLTTPLTYADRLRIRHPGDARFALGPHMDGGSVERWEDDTYRSVYDRILQGRWREYDAWDVTQRSEAGMNHYDGAGACGVFRAFQGWTSLSSTGPNEGTLRVYPYIKEQSAYVMLRPLFAPIRSRAEVPYEEYLSAENWELDLSTSRFPGAPLGRGQELNDETHPHLELERTMISVPRVGPGDQAWWHCDTIHSVESQHRGKGPSAVMYIPAVPLTRMSAEYVRNQRESFLSEIPPPDFPGGDGEKGFKGVGKEKDVVGSAARNAMGLQPFELPADLTPGERAVREEANRIFV